MTRQSTTGPLAIGMLRTRTRLTALTAILCASAALAGCSSGDDTTAAESTAPTLTASAAPLSTAPADPEATAKETALEVYQSYWGEMQAFYADRDGTSAGLKQYAASEALSVAENAAGRAHARGRVYIGKVTVSQSAVTGTDLDSRTPKVMLSSCLDVSQWQPVVADTRKPVELPVNRLTKYLIATTVEKWPQGWRVVRDEPQGKKC
ncbi:hypothetical protein AB0E04_46140 [Streptomyces sp. NPDC048251]|uniref:hypothetical protein n=1 Tax=Streptomyces sp. NPDC048251 TaxID=3154501 RepID=UPI0034326779